KTMKKSFVLLYMVLAAVFSSTGVYGQYTTMEISSHGSSRATAYSGSNKILVKGGFIYVLTLDYLSGKYLLVIRQIDIKTAKVIAETIVDDNIRDNHGGGAMVMDSEGI